MVEASDVVLEVLDARDPLGCRCVQVEQAVLDSGSNKKLILVLNKIGMSKFLIFNIMLSLLFSMNRFSAERGGGEMVEASQERVSHCCFQGQHTVTEAPLSELSSLYS